MNGILVHSQGCVVDSSVVNMFNLTVLLLVCLLGISKAARPPCVLLTEASCQGRCDQNGVDHDAICQCNEECVSFGDCCDDYLRLCQTDLESCAGRCGENLNPDAPCQCNSQCHRFDDCCQDYDQLCDNSGPIDPPTDDDLVSLTEELWAMDENRLPDSHIEVDPPSSDRFITYVDESYFSRPTYAAFLNLMDNYHPELNVPDPAPCEVCLREQEEFLDAIMATRLMQRVWLFLSSRGYASGDESQFRAELSQYWFLPYSRSGSTLGSSGFEHVFLGELETSTVSGFHNWVQFYAQEENSSLDYKGYLEGCQPSLHVTRFDWEGRYKSIGSLFVGTSPEFELGVYTVCFLTRRNGACPVSLDGHRRRITTYTMSGVSPVTVGTAYPDC